MQFIVCFDHFEKCIIALLRNHQVLMCGVRNFRQGQGAGPDLPSFFNSHPGVFVFFLFYTDGLANATHAAVIPAHSVLHTELGTVLETAIRELKGLPEAHRTLVLWRADDLPFRFGGCSSCCSFCNLRVVGWCSRRTASRLRDGLGVAWAPLLVPEQADRFPQPTPPTHGALASGCPKKRFLGRRRDRKVASLRLHGHRPGKPPRLMQGLLAWKEQQLPSSSGEEGMGGSVEDTCATRRFLRTKANSARATLSPW